MSAATTPIYAYHPQDNLEYRVVNGTAGNDELHAPAPIPGQLLFEPGWFHGRDGDDVIYGSIYNDRVLGGNGNDTLYGGAGLDRYFGGAGDDVISDNEILSAKAGEGNDRIETQVFTDPYGDSDVFPSLTLLNGGGGHDRFELRFNTDPFDAGKAVVGTAVIQDFHHYQGDQLKLAALDLDPFQGIAGKQLFNGLDADHNGKLNAHDGAGCLGSVTRDGEGDLHLRVGQGEVELLHVAQLTNADFIFG
jgi:Ca2+-binding RTX toxin-like protein